jgi:hypothetical protein
MNNEIFLIEKTLNDTRYFLKKFAIHRGRTRMYNPANTMTWTKNVRSAHILDCEDDVDFFKFTIEKFHSVPYEIRFISCFECIELNENTVFKTIYVIE